MTEQAKTIYMVEHEVDLTVYGDFPLIGIASSLDRAQAMAEEYVHAYQDSHGEYPFDEFEWTQEGNLWFGFSEDSAAEIIITALEVDGPVNTQSAREV
jgi:hypothetical protein